MEIENLSEKFRAINFDRLKKDGDSAGNFSLFGCRAVPHLRISARRRRVIVDAHLLTGTQVVPCRQQCNLNLSRLIQFCEISDDNS